MRDLDQWSTSRLLTTAARLVEQAWRERLVQLGVTDADVIALGVLAEQGGMTQASLAQWVRVQGQSMDGILSHLESRGCVLRELAGSERTQGSPSVSISAIGRRVLDDADDIERTLVAGGALVADELRQHLTGIVSELGGPERTRDLAGSDADPEAVPEAPADRTSL